VMSPLGKPARVRRLIGALLFAAAGCALVFYLVLWMNSADRPEKKNKDAGQEIVVEAAKKKKPPPKRKKKPPKRKRTKTVTKRAPLPNLATAISGVSFGLPQLEGMSLDEMTREMLGEEATGNMVMTAGTVDEIAKPVQRGRIEYPKRARAKNIEGYVVLNLLISETGNVDKVTVLESEPPGVFDQVAVAAVQSWRFRPAVYKGKPVAMRATQKIPFKLGG